MMVKPVVSSKHTYFSNKHVFRFSYRCSLVCLTYFVLILMSPFFKLQHNTNVDDFFLLPNKNVSKKDYTAFVLGL